MDCEVCGGSPVTVRLETPKGSYYLDWPCEQLAQTLIRNGSRSDRWELVGVYDQPGPADQRADRAAPSAVLSSMLDRSAS